MTTTADAEDLELAVERHATSKLPGGDLFAIATLGFRGEALPSIGAVARLSIATRTRSARPVRRFWSRPERRAPCGPSQHRKVRASKSPTSSLDAARLKFLKSDRAEAQAVADAIKRIAVAHPAIRFTVSGDHLTPVTYAPEEDGDIGLLRRLSKVLGAEFNDNAVPVRVERDGIRLSGFAGLPTFHRGASTHIHFVVNGRPVRDKLLLGAVRGAYADVMPSDRHPVLALMIELDPRAVDVNVHPAKTEVRFRDPALVRSLVVAALKEAIGRAGFRAATTGGLRTLGSLRPEGAAPARRALSRGACHRSGMCKPSRAGRRRSTCRRARRWADFRNRKRRSAISRCLPQMPAPAVSRMP